MGAPRVSNLTSDALTELGSLDRAPLVAGASRLTLGVTGDWLPPSNPYLPEVEPRFKSDGDKIDPARFDAYCEYLASSAFIHCGDGWSYLGRAADALLRGDIEAAVHLIYYCELRAALSILASEGIYIGNRCNIRIGATGAEKYSNLPTHDAVWASLDWWATQPRAVSLLSDLIRPGNATLGEWVSGMPVGGAGPVISALLKDISFDLQAFALDRSRRNRASYRPTRQIVRDLEPARTYDLLISLWEGLEPDRVGGFPRVDEALLRNVLMQTYTSITKQTLEWPAWIGVIAPAADSAGALAQSLVADGVDFTDNSLLAGAFIPTELGDEPTEFVDSMLSRAVILLRIATGSCSALMDDAGASGTDLQHWVGSLLTSRGILDGTESMSGHDSLDSWADVEDAISDINADPLTTRKAAMASRSFQHVVLGQFERVVGWSFA